MVQRGSVDLCECKQCPPRRYHTRSTSNSCPNQAALIPLPADYIPPEKEQHGVQVATPVSEGQGSTLSTEQGDLRLVSIFFDSLTRLWSSIIRGDALLLSPGQYEDRHDRPPSPPTTIANDTTSIGGCSSSQTEDHEFDCDDEPPFHAPASIGQELETTDCTPVLDKNNNLTRFNLNNFLLEEELKRLLVWKASFSNDELNRLPDIEHEIAQGVLKCLTSVANTLIKGYSGLEREKESLRHLVERVASRISEASVDDEVMAELGDFSETQGSNYTVENETPLDALRFEIDRLHMLSHSLRLELSSGVTFAERG